MDFTLRQAELFLSLARSGRIKNVAQEFCLTESAVSTAIKRFEELIGVPLFDRAHKKISLNSNGQLLADEMVGVVKRFHDVSSMFQQHRIVGHMLIGASQTFADYLLPSLLYNFHDRYPQTRLEIWSGNSDEVVRAVELGEVPLGFIEGEVASRLISPVFLASEDLIVVTSDREMAGRRRYCIDELLGYRWVLREPGSGTRAAFVQPLQEKNMKLNVFLELPHIEAIKSVLGNAGTLSCLSRRCVRSELEQERLYAVGIDGVRFPRNFYMVMHPRQEMTNLMDAVAAGVVELLLKSGMTMPAD